VHLRRAHAHLVSCLFEPGIYFTGRGGVQLRKTGFETCPLGKKVISPYVGLENRVEGCGIVARNLHIHYINTLEVKCIALLARRRRRMVMCEGIGTSGDMPEEIQSPKDVAGGVCGCRRCEQKLVPIFVISVTKDG
jgi:hypothetical protein